MVNTVASILKTGASINLYMFHGGTNFGFMNGALEADEYKSDVTSYGEFILPALPVHLQLWRPWASDSHQQHWEMISTTPLAWRDEVEHSSEANTCLKGGFHWCSQFPTHSRMWGIPLFWIVIGGVTDDDLISLLSSERWWSKTPFFNFTKWNCAINLFSSQQPFVKTVNLLKWLTSSCVKFWICANYISESVLLLLGEWLLSKLRNSVAV